jgi:hypothetical protein
MTEKEREWGVKASRFIKAELKRANVGYKELAERLNQHGLRETETSITGKLGGGAPSPLHSSWLASPHWDAAK